MITIEDVKELFSPEVQEKVRNLVRFCPKHAKIDLGKYYLEFSYKGRKNIVHTLALIAKEKDGFSVRRSDTDVTDCWDKLIGRMVWEAMLKN